MTYREEQSVGREVGFGVVAAPVDDGLGGDVQAMQSGEGVRFSVEDEARRRRGQAGVAVNSRALDELRQRCKLEAVASVLPRHPKHVKEVHNHEGQYST